MGGLSWKDYPMELGFRHAPLHAFARLNAAGKEI
jgi:hypothetical protein